MKLFICFLMILVDSQTFIMMDECLLILAGKL